MIVVVVVVVAPGPVVYRSTHDAPSSHSFHNGPVVMVCQVALHLIEEPSPPLPYYIAHSVLQDASSLGHTIDTAFCEWKEK